MATEEYERAISLADLAWDDGRDVARVVETLSTILEGARLD